MMRSETPPRMPPPSTRLRPASQIDERRVDEHPAKYIFELLCRPSGDDSPPATREGRADERLRSLPLEVDDERRQRRTVCTGRHAQTPASTVSRSGFPSMNCLTTGSRVC